jgi:hypothetical protein
MKYIFLFILIVSVKVHSICDTWPLEIEDYYSNAETVILVEVTSAWQVGEHQYKAKYVVEEAYKGNVRADGTGEVNYEREPHSIMMTPGKYYLLFLRSNNYVSICLGSQEINVDIRPLNRLRALLLTK